ncbi:MAG: biotin transporter BioY [Anaerolineae bacterium]|nr:biotin transporter BioY [Anaerolineae bacterium]
MSSDVIARSAARRIPLVASILFFAALTALTARIAIPLPFTPVPITLQVLAVLLSGLVLGARGGAASQLAYLAAILAGLPLSASGMGGPAAFLGPTAGYLLAFVPAAFVVGLGAGEPRASFLRQLAASLAGVLVIYLGGTAWLSIWLGGNVAKAWQLGVAPFVVVDLAKGGVAAAVARSGRAILHST